MMRPLTVASRGFQEDLGHSSGGKNSKPNAEHSTRTHRCCTKRGCTTCLALTGRLFIVLISFGVLVTYIVYGLVWWLRLSPGCELVGKGRVIQFWKVTLSMWILGIVTPLLAPFICGLFLCSWTTENGCERFRQEIFDFLNSDGGKSDKFQNWFAKWTKAGGDFTSQQICEQGHFVMGFCSIFAVIVIVVFISVRSREVHQELVEEEHPI